MTARVLSCVLLVAAFACDKGSGGGAAGAAGGGPRDAVIAAWKTGGLTPSPFTAATVSVGKDCQSGTVGAIDVLLCVYPSVAEAKAATDNGYAWVGEATGTVQQSGTVLIAIADRRKSEPSGRTMNQLMKLAPK